MKITEFSIDEIHQKVAKLKEEDILTRLAWDGSASLRYGYGRGIHTIDGEGDTDIKRVNDIWEKLKIAIDYTEN